LASTQQLLVTVAAVPTIHVDVSVGHGGVDSQYGGADQIIMVAAEDIVDLLIETIWVHRFVIFSFYKIIQVEAFNVVAAVVVLIVVGVVVIQVVHSTWSTIFIITHGVAG
jgi:hypothetical protein